MKVFVAKTSSLLAILVLAATIAAPRPVTAQTQTAVAPTLIPLSGQVKAATGEPRTGTVLLVISLYEGKDDPAPRWIEHQVVTLDAAGGYRVQFGATRTDGLPQDLFTGDAGTRWIGVAVENEKEEPRIMLVSVPYAVRAASADFLAGKAAGEYVLISSLPDGLRATLTGEGATVSGSSTERTSEPPSQTINDDLTVTGTLNVTGFGTHGITAGGSGELIFAFRNASSGSGNLARLRFGNDAAETAGLLDFTATNFAASGTLAADAMHIRSLRSGGLNLSAENSSGVTRFFSGGATERMRITADGNVGIGDATPEAMLTVGSGDAFKVTSSGLFTSSGFGTHGITASGSGELIFSFRNSSSGSANLARLRFGNDSSETAGLLDLTSSNFTAGGALVADGMHVRSLRAGGLTLAAENASGVTRFFTGGTTERMRITADGNVGVGTTNPTTKLHVAGAGHFTGELTVDGNLAAKYQDVAEWVDAAEPLDAGSVVVIDVNASNRVLASTRPYDSRVAGAVSPQPGIVLGEKGAGRVLVAQSGRVRIKADARYAAIKPGDLLVTSPTKGHAMKSRGVKFGDQTVHRPGTLIGKALEALPNGQGEILVLLTLQ